jgi:ribosome-associated translation inhibitor RaiA
VIDVDFTAGEDVSRQQAEDARQRFASIDRYVDGRPLTGARLTVRRTQGRKASRPFVADAHVVFDGRVLAAHAAGASPLEAVDAVTDRLRRQLRRVVDADVAMRNEPRVLEAGLEALQHDARYRPEAGLKAPEEREIIRRFAYVDVPLSTLEAVADLLDLDVEFYLFRHVRTGEEVVVYRRDDGRIGLLHPPGSPLADENDVVVPQESRYPEPISLNAAREEMDVVNHRFLYFVDAEDGRGKVLYLRHDGDYGLVEHR